ncbi:hypothetical protein VIGAN_11113500, partial [Vigna angularis var. angularis]
MLSRNYRIQLKAEQDGGQATALENRIEGRICVVEGRDNTLERRTSERSMVEWKRNMQEIRQETAAMRQDLQKNHANIGWTKQ